MLGIIGAMQVEVETLVAAMGEHEVKEIAGRQYYRGTLDGHEVVVVQCGMGKVNAAMCVQALCSEFHVDGIVNTGVAGALAPGLGVFDVVVATDGVEHDFDLSPIGPEPGHNPDAGFAFPADERLRTAALAAARELDEGHTVIEGRIATGDQFIASPEDKERIVRMFGGACCEMEGAAILHAAAMNGVPATVVRVMSDTGDGDNLVEYDEFMTKGSHLCAGITRRMLSQL